jgi:hypothetical protein
MGDCLAYGATSVILRILIAHSITGQPLPALTFASSGMIVTLQAGNEAAPTLYTVAAGNVEDITTLGTYAAPTTSKIRFSKIDDTNKPGNYEIHIADARVPANTARYLDLTWIGAANMLGDKQRIFMVNQDASARPNVNLQALVGNTDSPTILDRSVRTVTRFTVGSGSTTTNIVTSSMDPAAAVTDQFGSSTVRQTVRFDLNTTTINLRGQRADCTGSTAGGVLTVSALTTAPVSGDTGVVV